MELSEAQINGRFRFLERPAVAPGKCACCGAVDKPVVDFGFDLDFYGVVYLCLDCLGEAVQVAGVHMTSAKSQVVPPPSVNAEAVDEYLRRSTESINRLIAILPAAYFDVEDDAEADESDSGVSVGELGHPLGTIPDAQGDDVNVDEPLSIEGPDDVPSPPSREPISF